MTPSFNSLTIMKTMLMAAVSVFLLNSCVFDSPFESNAKIPVDANLLGRWEEVSEKDPNRMLVLQHSANEYLVQYPVNEKGMFFRAYPVNLDGVTCIQLQLIGTAEGPVKVVDRKYHLFKVTAKDDSMEMSSIDPEVLGIKSGDPAALKAAFIKHKDDPGLFAKPGIFKRVK